MTIFSDIFFWLSSHCYKSIQDTYRMLLKLLSLYANGEFLTKSTRWQWLGKSSCTHSPLLIAPGCNSLPFCCKHIFHFYPKCIILVRNKSLHSFPYHFRYRTILTLKCSSMLNVQNVETEISKPNSWNSDRIWISTINMSIVVSSKNFSGF